MMEEESGSACVAVDAPAPPAQLGDNTQDEGAEAQQSEKRKAGSDESGLGTDLTRATQIHSAKEDCTAAAAGEAEVSELDSLPGGDELVLNGCTGSDSGVEGCGRALSSGGGSRSCASSVVSCGSGCGSESSSLTGAPHRTKRRVAVAEPPPRRSAPPLGASTPRVVPRGPNLATRERARSREKPTPPEKPRPLTPKPRVRPPPPPELPALARESPALRVKPTRTSTARCRTPNSPTDDKRWPPALTPRLSTSAEAAATRAAADKYGTLPRRRRDGDSEGSPKRGISAGREAPPPIARRPTVARASSSRGAIKSRVRIYAEIGSQTALRADDVEAALAGRAVRTDILAVEKVSRGVQADRRQVELERLEARARRAQAEAEEERARRERAEAQLEEERSQRRAAQDELERNTRRLLELSGAGGAEAGGGAGEAGAGGECLRALDEQLRAAAHLAAAQRDEIDRLRDTCRLLQSEASANAASARALERRLAEAEAEATEMQDFLSMEKHSLQESLRDTEQELAATQHQLTRRRAECRQLVRLCEQRRQETLAANARARGGGGAAAGLDALARRLRALLDSLQAAYNIAREDLDEAVFYNEAYSRSDSGGGRTPDEPPSSCQQDAPAPAASSLLAAVACAMRGASLSESRDDRSEDNSADLLDSETEPCLVTDAAFEEGSTSPNPTFGLATDVSSIQVTESRRATRAEGSSLCIEGEGVGGRLERGGGEDSCNSLHNVAAWSADELSPVRLDLYDEASERESLHNLSAAILQRQQSEAECSAADDDQLCRARILDKVVTVDNLLTELLKLLRLVHLQGEAASDQLNAIREKIGDTERSVAEVVMTKLAELEASRAMLHQYTHTVEELTAQLEAVGEVPGEHTLQQETGACDGEEALARYETLDACLATLTTRQRVVSAWPRLAALQARLERLAFTLLTHPAAPAPPHLHTTRTIDSAA